MPVRPPTRQGTRSAPETAQGVIMIRPSCRAALTLLGLALLTPDCASAARPDPSIASEKPDPATVRRYGPAYRYPRAGWIVLHIEGAPYERGYQHGRLLAAEIADYAKTLATKRSPDAPSDAWRETRTMVNALFLRKYDREYLEEMKGTADGAAAAGATLFGRPIDLLDIVTINSDIELEFLDPALNALATGLEGKKFRDPGDIAKTPAPPEHCSAFAATGPATADGKVVIGHITMFSLVFVRHFNVWLDVKPENGHRVMMQTYPGGIQSGMDYYQNDAGMVVLETTINQTKFDINGMALASRIRKAVQYSDTIDRAVETLREGNNGMYSNEWLLADTKTNEIAMFELGTHKSKLWRSSKDEWFGGTRGFYWGCNNAKDLDVRLETVASTSDRPANLVWHASDRDKAWLRLYDKHNGKISESFGFEAFTTAPLAAFPSCDAKFTTTALAKDLKSWGLFGPPLGKTWEPSDSERRRYRDVQPLVSNDWTLLTGEAPAQPEPAAKVAAGEASAEARQAAALRKLRDEYQKLSELKRETVAVLKKSTEVEGQDVKTIDVYRQQSDNLTDIEVRRIAASARLEAMKKLIDRSQLQDSGTNREDVDRAVRTDTRMIEVAKDLDYVKTKLDEAKRRSRDESSPSVILLTWRARELVEKKTNLESELAPQVRLKLEADTRELLNRRMERARAEIAELTAQEKSLKRSLDRLRPDSQALREPLEDRVSRLDVEHEAVDRAIEHLLAAVGDREAARKPTPPAECLPSDLPKSADTLSTKAQDGDELDDGLEHPIAWRGTILPKTERDAWLAAAFAEYQGIVARELAFRRKVKGGPLNGTQKDELAVALFAPYTAYKTAVARLGKDIPLDQTKAEIADDTWYRLASGKGVLLLAALREKIGDKVFLSLMDEFGLANAGKAVSTAEFITAMSKGDGDLKTFFTEWLERPGLPVSPKTGIWSIDSYDAELDRAVIVYGTTRESDAQREAASRLQRQIERRWSNITVPILADSAASTEAIKGKHLLLIGRPDTNSLVSRFAKNVPLTFGPSSFVLKGETFANPGTAVIAAGARPDDERYSVVLYTGLSAEATWKCVDPFGERGPQATCEIHLLPAGGKARRLVVERDPKVAETGQPTRSGLFNEALGLNR